MIDPLKVLLFLVLSAVAAVASLHAWRTHQAYGGFRFLAFESLALLIAWNARRWFRAPFSIAQWISWFILAGSTALAASGVLVLRSVGRAQARLMEDTRFLARTGPYRYIRHPLYASLMFFGWGVVFKGGDLVSAVLALIATAFWIATARYEERFNRIRFGASYSEYARGTKMFVPFVA
jgi:protein-S-isoprenylcysteine O-methyltransferase Ste14